MDASGFEKWVGALSSLTQRQRDRVQEALRRLSDQDQTAQAIQARLAGCSACPHCGAEQLQRFGQAHGLQRYRCKTCGKTFNALTGTPLARLRHKGRWLAYLQAMLESKTVRQAAAATGVHRNTSFRWRHRFLAWSKNDRPAHLCGITEADETYLLESEKGARPLKRKRAARQRGAAATKRGISDEQVCVLIARDRMGQTLDFVTGNGPLTKAQLRECLPPVLDEDVLLVSDGNVTYRYFAAEAGLSHESVNLSAGVRVKGAYHVQNVNAYHSRLHQWLDRFHGVATHYLPNYLGWRRALDSRRLATPTALLRAAVGVFPHRTVT